MKKPVPFTFTPAAAGRVAPGSEVSSMNGMSLIEIVFALAIVCFLLSVAVFQFIGTKKIHYISNEYLNKACLADILAKLIKDRIQVNPYFFKNINNAVVQNNSVAYLVNRDEDLSDALGGDRYSFAVSDFPVIAPGNNQTAGEACYFGLFKVENLEALMASDPSAFNSKAFLNVRDLQKYSFDLSITDEEDTSLDGILKNIDIKIKYGGPGDGHPFLLSTKAICPPESLSSRVYYEFQRKLFETSRSEFLKNMNDLLSGAGSAVRQNVQTVFDWLCSKTPPPLMFGYYAAHGEKLAPQHKELAVRQFKNVYFIIYVFDFNAYMQSLWLDRIDELSAAPGLARAQRLMAISSTYRKKAQLALQTVDQIRVPLGEICDCLEKGTKDTVAVMLASFLTNPVEEFLEYRNRSMLDIIKTEVKQLPDDFTYEGIKGALEKLNDLIAKSYRDLTPRTLHGMIKEMTAFNEVAEITAAVSRGNYANDDFKNSQDNIKMILEKKYGPDKFEAGSAYLTSETAKNEQIDNLVNTKYKVAAEKIGYFWDINRVLYNLESTLEVMTMAVNMNLSGSLSDLINNEDIQFWLELNRDMAMSSNEGVSRDEFLRNKYNISEEEFETLKATHGDRLNAAAIRSYVEQRDR